MVTPNMTEVSNQYLGLSTDEKPTGVAENCLFLELDTGTVYYYDSGSWVAFGEHAPVLLYENDAEVLYWNDDESWHNSESISLSEDIEVGATYTVTIGDYVGTAVAMDDGGDYPFIEYHVTADDSIGINCIGDTRTIRFYYYFADAEHDNFTTSVKLEKIVE